MTAEVYYKLTIQGWIGDKETELASLDYWLKVWLVSGKWDQECSYSSEKWDKEHSEHICSQREAGLPLLDKKGRSKKSSEEGW